ncbi:non-homologous end-joining DNA ligase [Salegentibacter sp.]|uniref:non-homologous end-joining DNA ligase n=1 Tax=Salegentibacter sp. TaxID=1903072 RepID=UPI003561BBE3
MEEKEKRKFGKYSVEISNRDKVFFPKSKYTKEDLLDYYEKISDIMIPHMKDRPVSMLRFPDGINKKQFYQKDAPDYFPNWIEVKQVKKQDGGTTNYVICNDTATLVYLANQACITPHIWLSKKDKLDYPDRMIFDLDPSDDDFSKVKLVAEKLKFFLEKDLNLPVFLMTTGSRGLHVVVPLERSSNFDEVRDFAQISAKHLEDENPEEITTATQINKRRSKLYIDTARNGFAQTSVAPYSIRPIEGAPVATPIDWEELENASLTPQTYNIKNIFLRLGKKSDPWSDINRHSVSITSAREKLAKIIKH